MMSEQESYQNHQSEESDQLDPQKQIQMDVMVVRNKYQRHLHQIKISQRVEVDQLMKKLTKKNQLNPQIDPQNKASIYRLTTNRNNLSFNHYFTKKIHVNQKKEVFSVIRDMLKEKNYDNISYVSDKQDRSIMVVRFIGKLDKDKGSIMYIQDEKSQREAIFIKQGIVWIGMICAVQAVWENNMYYLQRVIDLGVELNEPGQLQFNQPLSAYRMLMVKGPFWKKNSKDNVGVQLLISHLENLRIKQKIHIDLIVVMGPLLSKDNQYVKQCKLERTYQDQALLLLETLAQKVASISSGTQILILPSPDDVISEFPIPQPEFQFEGFSKNEKLRNVKLASNPCPLYLNGMKAKQYKIDFINYDLITYIDESKMGRATIDVLQQNLETYMKQPFYITNTLDDSPFDETNLNEVFNNGEFGNIVVMSSKMLPPFARKVKGRIFVNIGSLGIDFHVMDKKYMTLVSIYQGSGPSNERIKVQSYSM